MRRLIARFVLLSLLLSTFAPAVMALSAPSPAVHACCMRKMHARSSHEAAFEAASCCRHNCCNSLSRTHSAQTQAAAWWFRGFTQKENFEMDRQLVSATPDASHSGRAPPSFS